jgi:hypothetical protein
VRSLLALELPSRARGRLGLEPARLPNKPMKLLGRGGREAGKGSVLSAAAAARSSCADRLGSASHFVSGS